MIHGALKVLLFIEQSAINIEDKAVVQGSEPFQGMKKKF